MTGDYYCKSAQGSAFTDTAVELVEGRSRLLSVVVRPARATSGVLDWNSFQFTDGDGGTALYELVIPCSTNSNQARAQPGMIINLGGDGILFDIGIWAVRNDSNWIGVGLGSPDVCCVDTATIFYR